MSGNSTRRVLGLDLGANSIGWALVDFDGDQPAGLTGMGVRIFEAGTEGQIEAGKDESRGVERRGARQRRRQTKRQSWRMARVAEALQGAGWLPPGDVFNSRARHELLEKLDQQLRTEYAAKGVSESDTAGLREFPYFLRARALDEPLPPHALGRALYHLAIRRGFLSNRKSDKEEKELGVVKEAIGQLGEAMAAQGARTLGEFFFRVDPVLEKRIRQRWTARSMYKDEFEQIMDAQERLGMIKPGGGARKEIERRIFFQRPLKSQRGLVGKCELEPGKRRAPKAVLPAQRFRILQKVNDLVLHYPDGTARELNDDEKRLVAAHMDTVEEVSFAGLRRLLKAGKEVEFNLERGGEKKLKGNVTAAKMRKVFGDRWDELGEEAQKAVIGEVMGIDNPDTLRRRGVEAWGLDAAGADALAKVHLEEGYCALSREALKKLLPHMEKGDSFKTAENEVYGDSLAGSQAEEKLVPVEKANLAMRNPVVMRTLTELRKVVNAVIAKHGKPDEIHIELARDLKKSREDRKKIWQDNRKREERRGVARLKIDSSLGLQKISRDDLEKVQLAEECGWVCPYTGKSINMSSLLGEHPQFDVEHIIPFSRCLDDSFLNKTLCYHEENRSVKGNKTPWEAYGDTPAWDKMILRVQNFTGDAARQKLERFQAREIKDFDEFTTQKLNDTRYASKLAARYLSRLYGAEARSRILTNTGQVTAILRSAWKLNGILGEGDFKTRDDHRHHAVDALVIAMTNRAAVKHLSDAAQQQKLEKGQTRGFVKKMPVPWDTFLADVRAAVGVIIVSHRTDHRVNGRLHEDTIFGPPRTDDNGKTYHVVRKPLNENFRAADVENIVDEAVREAVRNHLAAHNGNAKAAFADAANRPRLPGKHGGTPIHRVRYRRNVNPFRVGEGEQARWVTTDSNHHMEIIEETRNGKKRWTGVMVDRFEAVRRLKFGEPVIQKDHGEGKRFVCSLAPGDTFQLTEDDKTRLCIVRSISNGNAELISILDSRKAADIKADAGCWQKRSADILRTMGFEKVVITPIGEVYPAND